MMRLRTLITAMLLAACFSCARKPKIAIFDLEVENNSSVNYKYCKVVDQGKEISIGFLSAGVSATRLKQEYTFKSNEVHLSLTPDEDGAAPKEFDLNWTWTDFNSYDCKSIKIIVTESNEVVLKIEPLRGL